MLLHVDAVAIDVSESLPVELNAGSVHAVDAPGTFTARGPFHLELSNEGGAVHVHVHLDEDLSRAARVNEVNHYVGSGETVRIPIGTVSGHGEVTGHLEVVSGYGAERERIEVTVGSASTGDAATRGGPERDSTPSDRDMPGIAPSSRSDGDEAATGASRPSRRHSGRQSTEGKAAGEETAPATGGGTQGQPARPGGGGTAGGARIRSLPADPTAEAVAFAVLAAVAVVVGVAVILVVREPVLSLVVAGVVAAAVAVVGWLLFE